MSIDVKDHEALFIVAQIASTFGGGIIGGTISIILINGMNEIQLGTVLTALGIGVLVLLVGVILTVMSRRTRN